MDGLKLRIANDKDFPFIASSFFQSHYKRNYLGYEDYKHYYNKLIKKIVHSSYNMVACDSSDDNLIFGYICYDTLFNEKIVHYVYVKAIYRRFGIATELIKNVLEDDMFFYYTHKPEEKKVNDSKLLIDGKYNDLLRFREFYEEESK